MKIPSQKTVSVVLATHNGSKYIRTQIASLFNQTLLPHELIVADDASSDETLAIIRDMTKQAPFNIKIICRKRPLGYRENFLQASLTAEGDFIAFCDQDDIWHPTKLEQCSKFFLNTNVSMIVHAAILIDHNSRNIGIFRQGINETAIRPPLCYDPWSTFWGFSIVFRRELLTLASITSRFIDYIVKDELIAHDRWITFLAQMVGSTAEIMNLLVEYRQHDSNLCGAGIRRAAPARQDLRHRTENYLLATQRMIKIVQEFPKETSSIFPEFNKTQCLSYLNRALNHLLYRERIYQSRTRLASLTSWYRCYNEGYYREVHGSNMRWKSVARDAKFAILRT